MDAITNIVGEVYYTNKGMNVSVETDLTSEPVDIDTLKEYLGIDGTDLDPLFTSLITTAREQLEHYTNRSFGEKTLVFSLDEFGPEVKLPYGEVATIESVEIDGEAATLNNEYKVTASKKLLMYAGSKNLVVTYKTKSAIPNSFKDAIKAQVAHLYAHRGDESFSTISKEAEGLVAGSIVYNLF